MKPASPRAQRATTTREHIIAAANALFVARGFAAVGMRDVASFAGVSTGAIFGHFADKAALFKVATGQDVPDVAGFLREVAGRATSAPIGELKDEARLLLLLLVGDAGGDGSDA